MTHAADFPLQFNAVPVAHLLSDHLADGLDLEAPGLAVPVGITCRQCPRTDCAERAFERIEVPGEVRPPAPMTG